MPDVTPSGSSARAVGVNYIHLLVLLGQQLPLLLQYLLGVAFGYGPLQRLPEVAFGGAGDNSVEGYLLPVWGPAASLRKNPRLGKVLGIAFD
jgi:hypothetical protein